MDARTVLLVSRGTMSGGQMLGECLAQQEGIRCLTREHLLAAVNQYGDLATRVTDQVARAIQSYEQFSELRRPYQILMRKALLESARQGHLAYFGYSGHLLLDRVRHFVRIRLIAPMELRIARTQQRLGYTEADAREYIRKVDQERLRWARLMYGRDIRDPALYDLRLNIERLSMEGACDSSDTLVGLLRILAELQEKQVAATLEQNNLAKQRTDTTSNLALYASN